jgi:hypothetical protein
VGSARATIRNNLCALSVAALHPPNIFISCRLELRGGRAVSGRKGEELSWLLIGPRGVERLVQMDLLTSFSSKFSGWTGLLALK